MIDEIAIVLLGRNGDLLNILPIARAIALRTGKPTPLVVSKSYLPLLNGVSYVQPDGVHYQSHRADQGMAYAKAKYKLALGAQVWGKYALPVDRSGDIAYNVAAWRACGFHVEQFRDTKTYPLVIDRRDAEREAFLLLRARSGSPKPLLLYNLGCSQSSPFNSHYVFQESLVRNWSGIFHCVNLCHQKASRLYDVLGLMDAASVLIATDTSALHLAPASRVPVIAIVNDKPWISTEPRCNVILKLKYSEAIPKIKLVNETIGGLVQASRTETSNLEIPQPPVVGAEMPLAAASVSS